MEEQKKLQDILMNIATRYINIELSEVEKTLNRTLGEMATFISRRIGHTYLTMSGTKEYAAIPMNGAMKASHLK